MYKVPDQLSPTEHLLTVEKPELFYILQLKESRERKINKRDCGEGQNGRKHDAA